MKKQNWVWMPHAAHLITGDKCQFHLATYVGGYIVSTIGEHWPDRDVRRIHAEVHDPKWHALNNKLKGDEYDHAFMKRFGFEELGHERTYETFVFPARKKMEGCKACPYKPSDWGEIDSAGYRNAEAAYLGHLKFCKKWAAK